MSTYVAKVDWRCDGDFATRRYSRGHTLGFDGGLTVPGTAGPANVSPRYAVEIQFPYQGYGLQNLLRTRLLDLYGIVNGIDMDQWNPETDPLIVSHYNADNFEQQRPANKRQLQQDIVIFVVAAAVG